VSPPYATQAGSRFPAGATASAEGVNFCAFSRDATRVEFLLYGAADSPAPFQVIALDPEIHRSFFLWHVFVAELPVETHFTWRMDGPNDTALTGRHFYHRSGRGRGGSAPEPEHVRPIHLSYFAGHTEPALASGRGHGTGSAAGYHAARRAATHQWGCVPDRALPGPGA
jgi:hypothetical protein